MLLASVSKRFHAILRQDLEQIMTHNRPQGQLGGFSGQQTAFGAQALRVYGNIAKEANKSCAVLFIDLQNAFHRLPRELAVGVLHPEDWKTVLDALEEAGTPMEAYAAGHSFTNVLDKLKAPPLLVRALRSAHANTWFTLTGNEIVRTARGTRPGSPIADIVFHLIMFEAIGELDQWIKQQTAYQQLQAELHIHFTSIVWADDVAIPWMTHQADQLLPALTALQQKVHQVFAQRGLPLNYAVGKTNAVLTFRGAKAPEFRQQYQMVANPGITIQVSPTEEVFLPFVLQYKHLGAMYTSAQTIDMELRHRAGTARSAFQQIAKTILCNKHLPEFLRVRMFGVLICTKLFHGLGSWPTPTTKQLKQLNSTYVGMLRKVLRLGPTGYQLSNAHVLERAGLPTTRVRLASERLMYAQRVFQVGPVFLQEALHAEKELCNTSWLQGLQADLAWMQATCLTPLPEGIPQDLTRLFDLWQQGPRPWRKLVKQALRRHDQQERAMQGVHDIHADIFRTLASAGATFEPDPLEAPGPEADHRCHCGRSFTTPQGLATHRWQVHKQYSPEFDYITGSVCQACLQDFWTSGRLHQHLSYAPRDGSANRCFTILKQMNLSLQREQVQMPHHVQGLNRREALQVFGPYRAYQTATERAREEAQHQVEILQKQLHQEYQLAPQGDETQRATLLADLTEITETWFRAFVQNDHSQSSLHELSSAWVARLAEEPEHLHPWAEGVFLYWGRYDLETYIESIVDGYAEPIIADAFADTENDLPKAQLLKELRYHKRRVDQLTAQEEQEQQPQPHRPVHRGTANPHERAQTQHEIPRRIAQQCAWQERLRQVKWNELPPEALTPTTPLLKQVRATPHFIVVHLFSGRRRLQDFHWHLDDLARRMAIQVTVLSLDTAVSSFYGNLEITSTTWERLCTLYEQKWVAGTLTGPPCETFSEARFTELPGAQGPRPLRSHEQLFGLEHLKSREYKQLAMGSKFFLQSCKALVFHLIYGGIFVGEHPAPPADGNRPTIWRSALVQLLLQHPDVCLHVVPQWLWGAGAIKPTGLITVRLPYFKKDMYDNQVPFAIKPTAPIIGRFKDGTFKTSEHKEYPGAFCKALAFCFLNRLKHDYRNGKCTERSEALPEEVHKWFLEARGASTEIRAEAQWLPDFQG